MAALAHAPADLTRRADKEFRKTKQRIGAHTLTPSRWTHQAFGYTLAHAMATHLHNAIATIDKERRHSTATRRRQCTFNGSTVPIPHSHTLQEDPPPYTEHWLEPALFTPADPEPATACPIDP